MQRENERFAETKQASGALGLLAAWHQLVAKRFTGIEAHGHARRQPQL